MSDRERESKTSKLIFWSLVLFAAPFRGIDYSLLEDQAFVYIVDFSNDYL